jgi:glycosyltransferase 2 family protein
MGAQPTAGGPGGVAPARFARFRRWIPLARVLASVVMLAVLLREVDFRSLLPAWDRTTILWLAGGMAFTTLGIVLSAVRWQRVLAAMDDDPGLGPLLNAYLASQFVSNFLPSTIGGDAVRVTRLAARDQGGAPTAFASVVLDRMSGWLILPLLCLAGLLINPTLLHLGRSSRTAVALSLVTLLALGVVLVVAGSPRLGGRLAGHSNWLRFMGAVHVGLDRIRRRPGAAAQVIGASIVYQLAIVCAGLLAAHALGISVGPTAMLAFIPAVAIIQVVPVTIGGLGLREGAFVFFLEPLGVRLEQAVALGLLMYAMHLLASLLGAPSFAIGHRPRPAT